MIKDSARMTMLRYGLDRLPNADGPFNVSVRDVVLWKLLREQMPHLELEEMREALEGDQDVFTPLTYKADYLVDGVYSKRGYQFDSVRLHERRWNARRHHYLERLQEWDSMPRPPVAVLDVNEVALTSVPFTVRVSNEGFGGIQALCVESVQSPPWVCVEVAGLELRISSLVQRPGVYHGVVAVRTNGGTAQVAVIAERLDFPAPTDDFVTIDSFFEEVEGLDVAATRDRVEAYLTELGFEMLPGGSAVQKEVRPLRVEGMRVRLEPAYIEVGEVPLPHRVDPEPRLVYRDGHDPGYEVTYENGMLSGLRDLFVDYEARAGQYLVLRLLSDGYEFSLEDPNPLVETPGYRYWLLGSASDLDSIPNWKRLLHTWLSEGEVNVLVRNWEENAFTRAVENLHRSGAVTVKRFAGSMPTVVVIEGEAEVAVDPLRATVMQLSTNIGFLWRQGELLDGRDVREEAQDGSSSDGLVLPLTPLQRQLAESLRPMPAPTGTPEQLLEDIGILEPGSPRPNGSTAKRVGDDGWWFLDSQTRLNLIRLGTAFLDNQPDKVGRTRILPARRFLSDHGVTADQVNYYHRDSNPISVTQGGWLTRTPSAMSLTQLAEAVVSLTAEPMHHSQLRQICEALLGEPIDPSSFLGASLKACGWAGPGYRRARIKNEPAGTNLPDVVRSLLGKGYLKRHEVVLAARRFLRVSPERVIKAYDSVVREIGNRA